MGLLVILLVQLTLLLGPAGAQTPVMDPSLPAILTESFYPDPDGMLSAFCELCNMSAGYCACVLSNPPCRPTFVPSDFLNHPEWPGNSIHYIRSPSPELEPLVLDSTGQPLAFSTIQQLEENATTVQHGTIEEWTRLTYNAGDRTSPPNETQKSPRRQAARENGFPCTHLGCEKAFNRKCDMRRHRKTHLESSERPHKCSVCQEGYIYPKDRDRHQRTHTSLPPQVFCHIEGCSRVEGFSRRDNLLRHIRKQHPGVVAV